MKYVIAIIILSILIIVHEFGHFLLAKKNGIMVKEFSLGMGPRLISLKKGETRYSLKLLPIGGSCIMLGDLDDQEDDDSDEELTDEQIELRKKINEGRSFSDKSVWARIAVLAAGPIFNFLLAFVLAMIVIGFAGYDPSTVTSVDEDSNAYEAGLREGDLITEYNGNSIAFGRELYLDEYINPVDSADDLIEIEYVRDGETYELSFYPDELDKLAMGISYYATDDEAEITAVLEDSPIEEAGVETGDVIVGIDGTTISSGEELQEYMEDNPLVEDQTITVEIERDGDTFEVEVTPAVITYYTTGFSYNLVRETTSPLGVIKYSFKELGYQIEYVYRSLGMLFSGQLSADDLSGPVGIVDVIGDTYDETKSEGVAITALSMANIAILLSANLGVMNLLPIPALDGGRLVFAFIEVIRRKPISKEKEGIVHFIGMVFLFGLMIFIVVNDIKKL